MNSIIFKRIHSISPHSYRRNVNLIFIFTAFNTIGYGLSQSGFLSIYMSTILGYKDENQDQVSYPSALYDFSIFILAVPVGYIGGL